LKNLAPLIKSLNMVWESISNSLELLKGGYAQKHPCGR